MERSVRDDKVRVGTAYGVITQEWRDSVVLKCCYGLTDVASGKVGWQICGVKELAGTIDKTAKYLGKAQRGHHHAGFAWLVTRITQNEYGTLATFIVIDTAARDADHMVRGEGAVLPDLAGLISAVDLWAIAHYGVQSGNHEADHIATAGAQELQQVDA